MKEKIEEWTRDLTSLGSLGAYCAVMIFLLFMKDVVGFIKLLICLILLFVIAFSVRAIFYKTRPENRGKRKVYSSTFDRLDSSSFPSVHAARTAVICVLVFAKIPTLLMAVYAACFLIVVMVSRIILKKHDIVDVLAGSVLGILVGYIFFIIL